MRLLTFVALYAGVLVAGTITLPVPSEYEWSPDTTADPSRFPRCLEVVRHPGTGWVRIEGLVRLGDRHTVLVPGAYATGSQNRDVLWWVPSRGDSFDFAGHHTLVMRFPANGLDTLVGRAYPPTYFDIYAALLARPMTVTAVRVECPRIGGGRKVNR